MATTFDKASLVMIPSGVKEDKLYSIKPTDGSGDFTFSRGSDIQATRVNSSGLIEKAKENLLLQSNTFDTTWVTANASVTGGQSGYDGSSDAWLLTATSSGANLYQLNSSSGVLSFSFYAKNNNAGWARLRFDNTSSPDVNVWVNLSDGSIGSDSGIATYTENIGGGWYRIVSQINTTDLNNVRIFPADSDGGGSSTNSIYIQDAQLNHGLIAQDYVETTTTAVVEGLTADLPRLDYSGGASCPSLLLEPSRTNALPYSEYFDTDWVKSNSTITTNYATSPEGVNNASLMTISSAFGNIYDAQGGSGDYAFSVYAKYVDMQYIRLRSTGSYVYFDIQNGNVETELNGTGYIEDAGNGWYKCSVVGNNTNTLVQIYLSDTEGIGNPTGTGSALIYGAQLEAGSYPTSYIPTYGTAAVRGGDICIDGGDSSTFNDSEGVLYAEISALANDSTNRIISVSDGSGSNRLLIKYDNSSNLIEASLTDGGIDQAVLTHTYTIINNAKIAFKYKANDFALWVNGTEVDTDSSGTIPSGLDTLNLDNGSGGSAFYGNAKQILYFPTALIDTELAALTTI